MNSFISFSGGVESSTMCILFGGKNDAIFADTGFEHQLIYERIELVENFCKNFHNRDFKIHKVKNTEYESLPDYILKAKFYPSFQTRFCTRMFKIEPITNFLKQYKDEGCKIMIGLNVDEIETRVGAKQIMPWIDYNYPLAENNLARHSCITILKKANLYPNFPPYMLRGGCKGCFYKSRNEYIAMALLNPNEFAEVEDLENKLDAELTERKKEKGITKKWTILPNTSMEQIRKYAKRGIFKPEEIYPVINNITPCGIFCNR